MMKAILLFSAAIISLPALAQTDTVATNSSLSTPLPTAIVVKAYPKNVIKMNVTSLLFHNYHFVYERSLTRKISASLGYRFMPTTPLGNTTAFKKAYKIAGEDEDAVGNDWNNIKAANKAITAEVRFYAGHKAGPRGFYAAVYGRYATFNVQHNYVYEATAKSYSIPIQYSAKGIGGGFGGGVQWLIGKRVALDWQIIGVQWGKLTGDGNGIADLSTLSASDKQYIKGDIEDMLPAYKDKNMLSAQVDNNGVKAKIDGPFVGLRTGISVGIAF